MPLPVSATDPTSGTAVTSVGFPGSVQSVVDASRVRASFKTGSVSSQQISELGVPRTEINADLSGGMSGGPTVDALGNVVGINSSKIVGDQAFNFITDASDLHGWLTAKGVTLTAANVPAPVATEEPLAEEVTTLDDDQAFALGIGVLVAVGAAIIGGLAALLAGTGVVGSVVLLVLLAAVCVVIWVVSRRNQVTSHNVTDSREVMVLASATPSTYPHDPRLAPTKGSGRSGGKAKKKQKKIKSGV